ncbi:MAG: 30S ribosomal protein S20 [Candidatus Gracilibacteria bacterium]
MPILKSAKKALKQNIKRRARNFDTRRTVKESMKDSLETLEKMTPEEANKALQKAYKIIDMAAKKRIFHKNTAARKKSRLAKLAALGANKKPAAKVETEAKAA